MPKLKHFSIPHLIHIEMSYACNSKCIFCYNSSRKSEINYKKIDKIVESVYNSNIPHVYLIGGEPSILYTKKLNEYINYLSKKSSVTIVTNGLIYKKLSNKLACIGVPIHGDEKTHESLTKIKGGYRKTINTIKKYISDGFDVRCIPVLMSINYNQIFNIIKLAKELGVESIFVDRFESGGIGSKKMQELKPNLFQFKKSLSQMILAKKKFNIPVGFGTAIPFCLDERLISHNMWSNCGVGITFGAINPDGNFRICNQSNIVYGNVLKEPIEKIWNKNNMNDYRCLNWVIGPCKNCPFLKDCVGGCKVDNAHSLKYSIDYAVRENKDKNNLLTKNKLKNLNKKFKQKKEIFTFPDNYRKFNINKYTKLNIKHKESYLVTRYQTIILDDLSKKIIKTIINGENNEKKIIKKYSKIAKEKDLRIFISKLINIKAIDLIQKNI
jgi:radical SAM protein with 4Fe4S-binding SPASM domain